MAIPARLAVTAFGLAVWVLVPDNMSALMMGVCVWDGVWAAAIAVTMGDISGRVPEGYRRGMKEL
jgi:hypothetical protein